MPTSEYKNQYKNYEVKIFF